MYGVPTGIAKTHPHDFVLQVNMSIPCVLLCSPKQESALACMTSEHINPLRVAVQ